MKQNAYRRQQGLGTATSIQVHPDCLLTMKCYVLMPVPGRAAFHVQEFRYEHCFVRVTSFKGMCLPLFSLA